MMPIRNYVQSVSLSMLLVAAGATIASAQTAETPPTETTMFPHPDDSRWWLSGQVNLISQAHGRFTSPYQGDNSLRPDPEQALSRLWTVYTGVKLPGHTELLFDVESAGGRGLSDALGLAGFTNLDVVRNPTLGSAPYIARAMVHLTVPLSREMVDTAPTPFSLATHVPARRIELRAGKLGMADFFDVNTVGSDSHLQFTNWTVDNNGAYDYAADTRGYTYAAIVEYDTPKWSVRFGEALMPTVANVRATGRRWLTKRNRCGRRSRLMNAVVFGLASADLRPGGSRRAQVCLLADELRLHRTVLAHVDFLDRPRI